MIMAGTSESAPELAWRIDLTSAGPVSGCMACAAMTMSGMASAIACSASVGLSSGLDPPGADGELPEDPAAAAEYAAQHPERQEVRIIAGVTRAGATYSALRLRSHDDPSAVVGGADLVPQLTQLLAATLESET